MKRVLASALAAALVGCATTGGPAPSGDSGAFQPPAVDGAAECALIGKQVASGNHKPAVDGLAALAASGVDCDREVVAATAESARVLAAADAWARQGLDARRMGDLAAARDAFGRALELYPKYHWVERLLADVEGGSAAAVDEARRRAAALRASGEAAMALDLLLASEREGSSAALAADIQALRAELADAHLEEAARAQQEGDVTAAVASTREAIEARPAEPVRGRVVDFARRLGLALFSAGELVAARDTWLAALALDDANEALRQYLSEVESRLQSLAEIKSGDGGAQ